MAHPFGDLLRQYCARKRGLSQTRLAHMVGYDQAILARMGQGGKDLTGPSGRERVVAIIAALRDEGVLTTLNEANNLLRAGGMPPLFEGQPAEAALIASLGEGVPTAKFTPLPIPTPSEPNAARIQTNLPAPLTSFVGREQEIAEVKQLLCTTRLLTLTGAGGCGKTRLALEIGASFVGDKQRLQGQEYGSHDVLSQPSMYSDGVWLIELASLADPSLVAAVVVAALRLPPSSRPAAELLIEYMRSKRMLLILDNCEHLVGACAELASALLRDCPDLHLLATSREALNVPGEINWRVPSMCDEEAALLFEQRARAVKPGFAITARNRTHVIGICEQLDGIPLAIELAVARLPTLSVEQIEARLTDRFELLTGGSRTALPRHRTLRAMIDWSYELLTDDERALLRKLSVFAGGWTIEAAECVWGRSDALDLLAQLVGKSLVEVGESMSQPRYRMLETIRQYANDKLVQACELEGVLSAHYQYFSGLADKGTQHVGGAEEKYWLDVLESELDNLRVALGWLDKTGDPSNTASLLAPVMMFWLQRGYVQEGIAWSNTLMAKLRAFDQVTLLRCMAYLELRRGNLGQSLDYTTQAHSLALRLEDEDQILETTLDLAEYSQDYEHGKAGLEHALRLARQTGKNLHISGLLFHLSWLLLEHGELDQAAATLTELLDLAPPQNGFDLEGKSPALTLLAILTRSRGDYLQARAMLEQSLMAARRADNRVLIADALVELANVMLSLGDDAHVTGVLKEAIGIYHWVGNTERVAQCLAVAARLAHAQGQPKSAIRLLASTADAYVHKRTAVCEHTMFYQDYERQLAALHDEVDSTAFEQSWAEGQAMTLDQAVDYLLNQ